MSAKEFLLQECENLKTVLEETLRYEYGLEGSREFFEECEIRLDYITQELRSTSDDNYDQLSTNATLLEELSSLISRIERSSLGEYSWPFVEELKRIAVAICTEATLTNPNSPPNIHVLSDGGLAAYAIFPERRRPSASKKRILTIIFPRTLKHFVLLHPILGHEIGHAVWRSSQHQRRLKNIVESTLVNSGGRFSSPDATADWLYDPAAPDEVKQQLESLRINFRITRANFFESANWNAWKEEILCDLVGLLTFGPSFVAAHCELLYALSPSGVGFGEEHPPVGSRVNMIIMAAGILGYDTNSLPNGRHRVTAQKFWKNLQATIKKESWFNIFSPAQIQNALDGIGILCRENEPASYQNPTSESLTELLDQLTNKIPPVGYKINSDKQRMCHAVDFRHILYAGWIASAHDKKIPFQILNRLCEHAIMQQRGIDMHLRG